MSDIRNKIFDYFAEREVDDVPILDPESLDKAIVGVTENQIVYSYEKLLEAYIEEFRQDDISDEDAEDQALDWISYNTMRSIPYMGENKPIIIYSLEYL